MHPLHDLFSHFLHLRPKTFGDCLAPDSKAFCLKGGRTYVRETQKVKCFRLPFSSFCPVRHCKPSKFDETGLLVVHLQTKLGKPVPQLLQEKLRFIPVLEPHDPVSSPGESHPQALSEPDVNLSAHPAPIIQPQAKSPSASGQRAGGRVSRFSPASIRPYADGDLASCISFEPTESVLGSYVA